MWVFTWCKLCDVHWRHRKRVECLRVYMILIRFALFCFGFDGKHHDPQIHSFYFICNFISFEKCELFINCDIFPLRSLDWVRAWMRDKMVCTHIEALQSSHWNIEDVEKTKTRKMLHSLESQLKWWLFRFSSEPERCSSLRLWDRWANLVGIDIDVAVCWIINECVSVAIQIDSEQSISKKEDEEEKHCPFVDTLDTQPKPFCECE